jgi:hypothetical protein
MLEWSVVSLRGAGWLVLVVAALMNLTFMQFFATWIGAFAGKVYGLTPDNNAFAHDYRTQCSNFGLNINLAAALAPISAYGGGLVLVSWKDALDRAIYKDGWLAGTVHPAAWEFKSPFKFTGKIAKVTVELKDMKAAEHDGAEEARRVAGLKKALAD